MKYEYIIEKIKLADFIEEPFRHLYIKDFLSEEDFENIKNDNQIHFCECKSNSQLRKTLRKKHYVVVNFPGCTTSEDKYYDYLKNKKKYSTQENCNHWDQIGEDLEGFGLTYQLKRCEDSKTRDLVEFFNSNYFHETLRQKFELSGSTRISTSIQKNLTDYEISPHPDIRQKALTFLLNINSKESDLVNPANFNTHMLSFKEEYREIYNIWKEEESLQRQWVPWHWCQTNKICKDNNSIVIFHPSHDTLHAVKLKYNHLKTQRTQIYGNLMYNIQDNFKKISYKNLKKS
jgi:hypothetical protein